MNASMNDKLNFRLDYSKLEGFGEIKLQGKSGNIVECIVIPKEINHIFSSEKGGRYQDFVCFPTPDSEYGSHMVVVSKTKEEQEHPLVGVVGGVVEDPAGPQTHSDPGNLPAIGRLSDVPQTQERIAGSQPLQTEAQQLIGKGQVRGHQVEAQGHRQQLPHVEPQRVLIGVGGDQGPDRGAIAGRDAGIVVPRDRGVDAIAPQPGQQGCPGGSIRPPRRRQSLPPLKFRQIRRFRPPQCELVQFHFHTSVVDCYSVCGGSGRNPYCVLTVRDFRD